VDVTQRQVTDWPEYFVEVDRARAAQLGLSQQEIASAVRAALSSSAVGQTGYWAAARCAPAIGHCAPEPGTATARARIGAQPCGGAQVHRCSSRLLPFCLAAYINVSAERISSSAFSGGSL